MRNIEIKARIIDKQLLVNKVKQLQPSSCETLQQEDIFFNTSNGRLKLRKFKDETGVLVFYKRSDQLGPKLSSYNMCEIPKKSVNDLEELLGNALGSLGIVKKSRTVYIVGQTRIHVDTVEGLGDFVELEVVLQPNQIEAEGCAIADDIMQKLDIKKDDLVDVAYADLLSQISHS